ncbi:MAG: TonB-dependent receptor [Pseudomonadales bacterium]|nr:TonB-dependent receptor [Pseudomonadales bacterium]
MVVHTKKTLVLAMSVLSAATLSSLTSAAVLEEVVVTAQKREQNLQDVSVAVTAFSGNALRELNMTNSVDIAGQTPGLNIGTPVGEGNNPSITLRGVGLNDFNDNNEGPIAVYRDEVYQSAMPGLTFQLFDMERVEVLRGPQGTLYGRNATGGLVHFISKKPTEEMEGYLDLSLAEYNQVKFEGAIGGSLTDAIQGRVSIATNDHDGYVDNRIGPDANEANSFAYRVQLNFDLSENFSALLNVHGGETDTVAPKYQHEATDFDGDGFPDPTDLYGYADTDGDPFEGDYDRKGVLDIESDGASLQLNWDGDNFDFVSITAVEYVDKEHQEDTDMGPYAAIEPTFKADIEQFSQEFRFSGETENMNWVAGLYYFESEADNSLYLEINNPDGFVDFLENLPEADGGFEGGLGALAGYMPGADPGALIPFLTYDVNYEQETESLGVFGQVEYNLADNLTLILGLRYTTEERDFEYGNAFGDRDGNGDIDNTDGVLTNFLQELSTLDLFPPAWFGFKGDIDNSNMSGKIGLDYRPSDNTLIFVSYSKGFKSGGFNGGFLDLTDGILPENTPYDEEILNSYEIGIKTTLANGALRFNATAFYYDYQDYQALTFSGLSQFINNSDAEVQGLDIEMVWLPNDQWDISLGASFLDTEVDQVIVQGSSFKGTEMVLAPEFSFNGLVRFQATEALSLQVDFNHQAEHFFDITNSDVSKEDSYTVFNARIGYKVSDNLTVAAYVKNLTDEEYRVYTFDFTGPAGFNQQFYAPPRWYGVNVNYSF